MRTSLLLLATALSVMPAALPASAYENFIPLGHNYSPDQSELPSLNSEQDQINAQVDIYESENYTRQRDAKIFSSDLNRFSSEQEFGGDSGFIDY
jgi:hypothetical protein